MKTTKKIKEFVPFKNYKIGDRFKMNGKTIEVTYPIKICEGCAFLKEDCNLKGLMCKENIFIEI